MEEFDLKGIFNIFWTKRLHIIIIVAILIVIGFMYSYILLVPKYQSDTSIILVKSTVGNNDKSESEITTTDITLNQKLVSTYSELIKSRSVLREVIRNLNINLTEQQLRSNISVKAVNNTEVIKITVNDFSAEQAKNIANEIAKVFINKIAKEIYKIDNVHIVDEAETPSAPYNINHIKDLVMFAFIGLVLAIIYVLISNMLDTTIKAKEEVEKDTGLYVLTEIPLCDFSVTMKTSSKKGGKRR